MPTIVSNVLRPECRVARLVQRYGVIVVDNVVFGSVYTEMRVARKFLDGVDKLKRPEVNTPYFKAQAGNKASRDARATPSGRGQCAWRCLCAPRQQL